MPEASEPLGMSEERLRFGHYTLWLQRHLKYLRVLWRTAHKYSRPMGGFLVGALPSWGHGHWPVWYMDGKNSPRRQELWVCFSCVDHKLSGFWGHKPSHSLGAVSGHERLLSRDSSECDFKDPGNPASWRSFQTWMCTLCLGFAFGTQVSFLREGVIAVLWFPSAMTKPLVWPYNWEEECYRKGQGIRDKRKQELFFETQ